MSVAAPRADVRLEALSPCAEDVRMYAEAIEKNLALRLAFEKACAPGHFGSGYRAARELGAHYAEERQGRRKRRLLSEGASLFDTMRQSRL